MPTGPLKYSWLPEFRFGIIAGFRIHIPCVVGSVTSPWKANEKMSVSMMLTGIFQRLSGLCIAKWGTWTGMRTSCHKTVSISTCFLEIKTQMKIFQAGEIIYISATYLAPARYCKIVLASDCISISLFLANWFWVGPFALFLLELFFSFCWPLNCYRFPQLALQVQQAQFISKSLNQVTFCYSRMIHVSKLRNTNGMLRQADFKASSTTLPSYLLWTGHFESTSSTI